MKLGGWGKEGVDRADKPLALKVQRKQLRKQQMLSQYHHALRLNQDQSSQELV